MLCLLFLEEEMKVYKPLSKNLIKLRNNKNNYSLYS